MRMSNEWSKSRADCSGQCADAGEAHAVVLEARAKLIVFTLSALRAAPFNARPTSMGYAVSWWLLGLTKDLADGRTAGTVCRSTYRMPGDRGTIVMDRAPDASKLLSSYRQQRLRW
jgi:hypothetical protein